MTINKIKEGVLQVKNTSDFNTFDSKLKESLLSEAQSSQLRRARINFHLPDAKVHEMIIFLQ